MVANVSRADSCCAYAVIDGKSRRARFVRDGFRTNLNSALVGDR